MFSLTPGSQSDTPPWQPRPYADTLYVLLGGSHTHTHTPGDRGRPDWQELPGAIGAVMRPRGAEPMRGLPGGLVKEEASGREAKNKTKQVRRGLRI